MPDSTMIPLEGLSEGTKALLTIVPIVMTVLLPIVVDWLKNLQLVDKIPTNFVSLGLAIILTLAFKYIFSPDLTFGGVVALVGMMGYGGTLLARGAKAITGNNKK